MIKYYPGLTIAGVERVIIEGALRYYGGNKETVAQAIGISVRTIQDRVKQYAEEDAILTSKQASAPKMAVGNTAFQLGNSHYKPEDATARKAEGIHPKPVEDNSFEGALTENGRPVVKKK